MRTIIVATAVVLFMPAAALSDPPAPQVESAGVHAGEPLICHYYYHEGSLVRRPICKTERQWVRDRLRAQTEVSDFQLRALRAAAGP